MQQALHRSSLVPRGFVVESAYYEGDEAIVVVRTAGSVGLCPSCGAASRRVHSHYRRRVTDLPLSGRVVQLIVIARRFRCDAVLCGRQIFTERFAEGVLAPSARRTARLDAIVHHLGLALGGRPAAGFAKRLMLPVSKDTLLRVVRRRHRPPADPLKVIGIDDWAWRRNHRYASIVCNLERRRIVTLLPDREPATTMPRSRSLPATAVGATAELWLRLTERGFRGSLRVISEWATRRRRAEKADAQNLQRIPSARTIARLMTIERDVLTKAETVTVAAIEAGVPNLVDAREIIAEFHLIIRRKAEAGLAPWIERARASLVASFANGVVKDEAAVRAAITSPWSNGQTEGQITRLKLVRRQMYGRGKIDLLQARLIGAQ